MSDDQPQPPEEPKHLTIAELTAALRSLKQLGVKTYVDMPGRGFQVEFFPPSNEVEKQEAPTAKVPDADVCACGHPAFAHPNGPCVEGCSAEECQPKEKVA